MKEITTQQKKANGSAKRPKATKAPRKKEMTAREATLRAWKKTYENRHRREKETTP